MYLGHEPSCRRCFHHWAKGCPTGNLKAKEDWPLWMKTRRRFRCLPEAGRSLCCLPVCKRTGTMWKMQRSTMPDGLMKMLLGRQRRNLSANASSSNRIRLKIIIITVTHTHTHTHFWTLFQNSSLFSVCFSFLFFSFSSLFASFLLLLNVFCIF